MNPSNNRLIAFAAIGAASVLFAGVSFGKLLIALSRKSNFASAFLPAPPRDAFAGKVFWITGASSGIGRALALHICSNHDNVKLILSSRRKGALEEVAADCRKRGADGIEVKVLTVDLSDLTSLPSKAKKALGMYGGHIDVLVNNGGVTTRSFARDSGFDVDSHVTNVDFLSYVSLTKALIPSWESQSSSKPLIINTSSVAGKVGVPVRTSYCGAKFAIQGWFDAFRIEQLMVGHPVDVLNVVLGSTRTNVARNAITESTDKSFGESDSNIEGGLDPEFVVGRVLATAYAGHKEIWIAPKKEMLILYLTQYMPDMAYKIMVTSMSKTYAIQKGSKLKDGEL